MRLEDIKKAQFKKTSRGLELFINNELIKHETVKKHETHTSCSLLEYDIEDSELKLKYVMGTGWALVNSGNQVEISIIDFIEEKVEEIQKHETKLNCKVGDKVNIDGETLTIKQIGGYFDDIDYGAMYKHIVLFEESEKNISINELQNIDKDGEGYE